MHCIDGETFLIAPGMPAPQSVIWAYGNDAAGSIPTLITPDRIGAVTKGLLERGELLVNHNLPFDAAILAVENPYLLRLFFDAFEAGTARCTMVREKLIRIARGEGRFITCADDEDDDTTEITRFDLASCAWRWLRLFVKKKDTWRLRYGELYKVPLEQWPQEAKDYPLTDVIVTRDVFNKQQDYIDLTHNGELPDEVRQNVYAWALKLVSLWGVRTDGEAVARLREALTKTQTEAIMALLPKGLFKDKNTPTISKRTGLPLPRRKPPEYSRHMAAIRERVQIAYTKLGEEPPLTKKGAISTATKTLKESGDEDLKTLANALGAMKLLSSFVPVLESGVKQPICGEYNVLVESGRTSMRKPNLQQMPRLTGIRETVVARPGCALVSVDYEMAELVGQAQMNLDLVGFSVLAEQINAGKKPIMAFAAKLAGMTYDQAIDGLAKGDKFIKARRHDSKGGMYGLPGGMRAKRLWQTMLAAGNDISLDQAKLIEKEWLAEYIEYPHFFNHVKRQVGFEYGQTGTIIQLRSGRIRGGCDFPAACNTYFQGLVADAAKLALARVVRESLLDPSSPLYGAHVVIFAHDEIIIECALAKVHEVGYRVAAIMIEAAKVFMPDVKMGAEPAAMIRWTKESKTTKDKEGRLVPCDVN